jgi:hypothetical protein
LKQVGIDYRSARETNLLHEMYQKQERRSGRGDWWFRAG